MWQRGVPQFSPEWLREMRQVVPPRIPLHAAIPVIPLRRGQSYDVTEAHRRSHSQHEPLLAPHGFFRALPPLRSTAAIEFVERFGPLDWPATAEEPALVLQDFWAKHLRYVSVLRLWESRNDEGQLRTAFSDLYKNLDPIQLAEGWERFDDAPLELRDDWEDLEAVPRYPLGGTNAAGRRRLLPWEGGERIFEEWLGDTVFEKLREGAINIFHGELNVHIKGREPRWIRMDVFDPAEALSFQLSFLPGNLWQMIWELTGLDTAQVRSWRICPACNVLFYPKRSDQYYCRSEEQVRASKRNYARNRRQRERLTELLAKADAYQTPTSTKKF
jgi:hypothetical protein